MKRIGISLLFFLILYFVPGQTNAIYDPKSVPNNKIGIHILFPDELHSAKDLVNTSGGDWGYVTIPIQAADKDIRKWQKFMDEAKTLHLIPIIRLATEGDYFQKESWRKPTDVDIVDFVNFLDSLEWPVKNRYIIAFNEVNRADEWNGEANPAEYAEILSFMVDKFKSKNQDYFIISSGMDNAAATGKGTYSQYDYFELMDEAVPGIFSKIDGFSSHSYPNPAFSEPPTSKSLQSVSSFIFEKQLTESLGNKPLPIFITETGWDQQAINEKQVGEYFKYAFEDVWNDPSVVAVTPFLLKAGSGPFEKFSFLKNDGSKNEVFKAVESLKKETGKPILNSEIGKNLETAVILPVKDFSDKKQEDEGKELKYFVKWLFIPI